MPVSKNIDGTTWRLSFAHPHELSDYEPGPGSNEARALYLIEEIVNEVPADRRGRELSLQSLLNHFPGLRELIVEAHIFTAELVHEKIVRMSLSGAVALSRLRMPKLVDLRLRISGDEHGIATPIESFDWLLKGDGLSNLVSLDARGLDVELSKARKPTYVKRWMAAPILPQLRELGIPGEEVKLKELKDNAASFAHLDVLAVSRLRSATDKNPVGHNVLFESEFPDVPLSELGDAIESLPRLQDLKPSMKEEPFRQLLSRIEEVPLRFEEGPLSSALAKFCRRGQWQRVHQLMEMAKKKAPYRRAFMNVREKTQEYVGKYLDKHPDDQVGKQLFAELEEQNRL